MRKWTAQASMAESGHASRWGTLASLFAPLQSGTVIHYDKFLKT